MATISHTPPTETRAETLGPFQLAGQFTAGINQTQGFRQALGKHSLYALRDPRLPESLRLVN